LSCLLSSSRATSRQLFPSAEVSTSHDFICSLLGTPKFVRIV
jgi:hypothetical protein